MSFRSKRVLAHQVTCRPQLSPSPSNMQGSTSNSFLPRLFDFVLMIFMVGAKFLIKFTKIFNRNINLMTNWRQRSQIEDVMTNGFHFCLPLSQSPFNPKNWDFAQKLPRLLCNLEYIFCLLSLISIRFYCIASHYQHRQAVWTNMHS